MIDTQSLYTFLCLAVVAGFLLGLVLGIYLGTRGIKVLIDEGKQNGHP